MDKGLEKILNSVKVKFMTNKASAFISTVLFSLKIVQSDKVPTAAVDGRCLYINKDWLLKFNKDQIMGLLSHECWHVCMNHLKRDNKLDHERYNRAADYVINNMLLAAKMQLPDDGLWDKKYEGMSTLEVYKKLEQEDSEDNSEPNSGGWGGDILTDESASNEEKKALEDHITNIILSAAIAADKADQAGTVPNEIRRMIDETLNPKLPWRDILADYMTSYQKDDYSYKRPNRRYIGEDLHLPSLYSEQVGEIVVAIDTSGSVSQEMLDEFMAEVRHIHKAIQPDKLTIITFTTVIVNKYVFSKYDQIDGITIRGIGGTAIHEVLEFIKDESPLVGIIISDGYYDDVDLNTKTDLLYCIYDNEEFEPEYGKVLILE